MNAKNTETISSQLREIKQQNLEELYLIIKGNISNLIKYIFVAKSSMKVPQASLKLSYQFASIIKEEKKIIDFLLSHLSYIREEDIEEFIAELDELNEFTFNQFYSDIGDIEDAIDFDDPSYLNSKRTFLYLTESKKYQKQACNLVLTEDFVKEYLGFEKEFWAFINARTIFVDSEKELKFEFYLQADDKVEMQLFLPRIVDLNTALISVREYSKAHILYLTHAQKISNQNAKEEIQKYYLKMTEHFNI